MTARKAQGPKAEKSEDVVETKTVKESAPGPQSDEGKAGEFNDDPDKGYFGVRIDPTPNSHYSVPGVIAGKPTPETDPAHAAKVRAHVSELGR